MACATSTHPISESSVYFENIQKRSDNFPDDMETSISEAKNMEELNVSLDELLEEFRSQGRESELVFFCEICQDFMTLAELSSHSSKHVKLDSYTSSLKNDPGMNSEKTRAESEPEPEYLINPVPQQISTSHSPTITTKESQNDNMTEVISVSRPKSVPTSVITITGSRCGSGSGSCSDLGVENRRTSADSYDSGVSSNSSEHNSPQSGQQQQQQANFDHRPPKKTSKRSLKTVDQKSRQQVKSKSKYKSQNQQDSQILEEQSHVKNSRGAFITNRSHCNHPYSQIEPPLSAFSPVSTPVPVPASSTIQNCQNGNFSYSENKSPTQNEQYSSSQYTDHNRNDIPQMKQNYLNFQHSQNQNPNRSHPANSRDKYHPYPHSSTYPDHRYNTRSSVRQIQNSHQGSSSPHHQPVQPSQNEPSVLQLSWSQQKCCGYPDNYNYNNYNYPNYDYNNHHTPPQLPRVHNPRIEYSIQNLLSKHEAHVREQARLRQEYEQQKQLRREREEKEMEKRKLEQNARLWDAIHKGLDNMYKKPSHTLPSPSSSSTSTSTLSSSSLIKPSEKVQEDPSSSSAEVRFICNYCSMWFSTSTDLIKHECIFHKIYKGIPKLHRPYLS